MWAASQATGDEMVGREWAVAEGAKTVSVFDTSNKPHGFDTNAGRFWLRNYFHIL